MAIQSNNVFNLRSTLEKGIKFSRYPFPVELPNNAKPIERKARQTVIQNLNMVTYLMLSCMELNFQNRFKRKDAYKHHAIAESNVSTTYSVRKV